MTEVFFKGKLAITVVVVFSLASHRLSCMAADAPDVVPGGEQNAAPDAPVAAPSSEQKAPPTPLELQIGALELKLFGEVYDRQTVNQRMDRLERFAYGGATTRGTNEQRIDALRAAMSQPSPDGTKAAPLPALAPPAPQPPAPQPPAPQPPQALPAVVQQAADSSGAPQSTAPQIPGDSGVQAAAGTTAANSDAVKNESSSAMLTATSVEMPMPTPVLQSVVQQNVQRAPDAPVQVPVVSSAPLHLSMADFIAKCDNPKRTLQALADAINSDPVFTADLFFQRGQVELGLKDYKGALKDFSDAILKEPMRYKYYLGRAVVYRKMGNPFMAEKDIATARYTSRDVPAQVEFDDDTNSQR